MILPLTTRESVVKWAHKYREKFKMAARGRQNRRAGRLPYKLMNVARSDQVLDKDCNRREFLKQTVAGVGLAATGAAAFSQDSTAKPEMPMVPLGSHRVSRLIVGSNPMMGYSHTSWLLSRLMMDYYTLETMGKVLERCLELGINTWQTSAHEKVDKTLEGLRSRGRDMQWIFLANNPHLQDAQALKEVIRQNKPIAVVHHGQVTDRLWREGQVEKAHDFVKRVQDLGLMGGLSSHNPAVLRHAESHDWN